MTNAYDRIGEGYPLTRQPDPRIAERIDRALEGCTRIVNVGAGTGSYEPRDRMVVAVEPSATMIRQRAAGAGPVIQAAAERLPIADKAVDAALAVLTIHHWDAPTRGFEELRRVAKRRVVIFTWDQEIWDAFWLTTDYFVCVGDFDRRRAVPIGDIEAVLGRCRIVPVPIPHDCIDGFQGAYWRRPHAYLDPRVRAGISTFAAIPHGDIEEGLERLAADIESGAWHERHAAICERDELDLGYRLIVADLDDP